MAAGEPDIRILIPVHAHVKKYVESYLGSPVRLGKGNAFTIHLYNMLERKGYTYRALKTEYTHELELMVPELYYRNFGTGISPENVHLFNSLVEDWMKREFRHVLDEKLELAEEFGLPVQIQQCIHKFMDRFDLHQVMNYETLKKDYYRYRKRKEQEKMQKRA